MGYHLCFDLPVSTNKMYSHTRAGIRLSDEARYWKEYASLTARNQWENPPLEGEVVVYYRFFGTRADWDNLCKVLGDSMNGICWIDDSQVTEAHIYLDRKDKNRRVEVEIYRKAGKK